MKRAIEILCLISVAAIFFACETSGKGEQEIIVVRVPPFYNTTLTNGQNQWLWQEFLFPQSNLSNFAANEIPDAGVPNDDGLLYVALNENGSLTINSQVSGDINNTNPLRNRLLIIFDDRSRNGVFEPGNDEVVKAVGVKVPLSAKYADLITVVSAVKKSGADPIVLLLNDHLPYMKFQSLIKGK